MCVQSFGTNKIASKHGNYECETTLMLICVYNVISGCFSSLDEAVLIESLLTCLASELSLAFLVVNST